MHSLPLLAVVVACINAARTVYHRPPLDRLPRGRPHDPERCPLRLALDLQRAAVHAEWVFVYPDDSGAYEITLEQAGEIGDRWGTEAGLRVVGRASRRRPRIGIQLPEPLVRFQLLHDRGAFPELIAPDDDSAAEAAP